eukprot:TRINITY_DN7070_c0_g1_i2.p1 TRINITY_DN7070_c0_g1~~TRINITY_DN7070_c0_g1_i2.p1  ORF type:complete len:934 (+),score=188.14 TRINITY_DN7070_c0_g1_i2:58-2859(+)
MELNDTQEKLAAFLNQAKRRKCHHLLKQSHVKSLEWTVENVDDDCSRLLAERHRRKCSCQKFQVNNTVATLKTLAGLSYEEGIQRLSLLKCVKCPHDLREHGNGATSQDAALQPLLDYYVPKLNASGRCMALTGLESINLVQIDGAVWPLILTINLSGKLMTYLNQSAVQPSRPQASSQSANGTNRPVDQSDDSKPEQEPAGTSQKKQFGLFKRRAAVVEQPSGPSPDGEHERTLANGTESESAPKRLKQVTISSKLKLGGAAAPQMEQPQDKALSVGDAHSEAETKDAQGLSVRSHAITSFFGFEASRKKPRAGKMQHVKQKQPLGNRVLNRAAGDDQSDTGAMMDACDDDRSNSGKRKVEAATNSITMTAGPPQDGEDDLNQAPRRSSRRKASKSSTLNENALVPESAAEIDERMEVAAANQAQTAHIAPTKPLPLQCITSFFKPGPLSKRPKPAPPATRPPATATKLANREASGSIASQPVTTASESSASLAASNPSLSSTEQDSTSAKLSAEAGKQASTSITKSKLSAAEQLKGLATGAWQGAVDKVKKVMGSGRRKKSKPRKGFQRAQQTIQLPPSPPAVDEMDELTEDDSCAPSSWQAVIQQLVQFDRQARMPTVPFPMRMNLKQLVPNASGSLVASIVNSTDIAVMDLDSRQIYTTSSFSTDNRLTIEFVSWLTPTSLVMTTAAGHIELVDVGNRSPPPPSLPTYFEQASMMLQRRQLHQSPDVITSMAACVRQGEELVVLGTLEDGVQLYKLVGSPGRRSMQLCGAACPKFGRVAAVLPLEQGLLFGGEDLMMYWSPLLRDLKLGIPVVYAGHRGMLTNIEASEGVVVTTANDNSVRVWQRDANGLTLQLCLRPEADEILQVKIHDYTLAMLCKVNKITQVASYTLPNAAVEAEGGPPLLALCAPLDGENANPVGKTNGVALNLS